MRKAIAIACFVLSGMVAYAQRSDPAFQWAVTASGLSYHSDIVYKRASGQDLKLDVIAIEPLDVPKPTVLYIHGGGWVNGKKGGTTLAPLPYLYRGMNSVNVDYRLAEDALAPAAVEDCRCALRWVFRNAKKYGFDTNKIVVAGESAGGHLALTTGMLEPSAGFDNECPPMERDLPMKVAAIVSYSGPTDVVDLLQGPNEHWFALEWFGSLPNRVELARRLSPTSYVRPGLPAIIQAHGDHDPHVTYQQGLRLHEALDRAGDANELITLPGTIHGWAVEKELGVEERVFSALEKYGVLSH